VLSVNSSATLSYTRDNGTIIAINAFLRDNGNVITYNRVSSWSANVKKTFLIANF